MFTILLSLVSLIFVFSIPISAIVIGYYDINVIYIIIISNIYYIIYLLTDSGKSNMKTNLKYGIGKLAFFIFFTYFFAYVVVISFYYIGIGVRHIVN